MNFSDEPFPTASRNMRNTKKTEGEETHPERRVSHKGNPPGKKSLPQRKPNKSHLLKKDHLGVRGLCSN
jgi:hypothetical protein